MYKNRIVISILAVWLAIISCNVPGGQVPQESTNLSAEQLAGTVTALASTSGQAPAAQSNNDPAAVPQQAQATDTATPTTTPCTPMAVANTNANIRNGPGTVYKSIDAVAAGTNLPISGRNDENTWWYITYPSVSGGYAWIAMSVVTASCVPSTVAVIAAPPTPLPASGTCKDDYVYRLIKSSDKVCVSPASKAQADADNAAADSRKLISTYGPDTCKEGYVWREAYSGDHVCVTKAVHDQAAADNAVAATRWTNGAYGAHTCIAGYVWREAIPSDDVCVTVANHNQTVADNNAAASRVAGPNECISGYVQRQAFSGDFVCVTPEVKTQVAADNAAAPSHTW